LKGLAKELQIPVLVLSQLTRAPERDERGPQLSDLRESGAIEQDADVVMFIYRPHFFKAGATPEEREETELRIAKQRNGPTDLVKFVFRSRFTRFEEAAAGRLLAICTRRHVIFATARQFARTARGSGLAARGNSILEGGPARFGTHLEAASGDPGAGV